MSVDSSFSSWEKAVVWLRSQPDKKQIVMDCYYDDPLIDAAHRYWCSNEWTAVQKFLDVHFGGKALDVGAGRGIASYALARENLKVVALEPDSSPIVGSAAIRSLAGKSGLPIEVIQDFSESLPFNDNEFDFVFARAVLHHTRNLKAACREFFRVLKPGGKLIAIREHVISKQEDLTRFFEQHLLHRFYGGENAYLLEKYITAIRQSGFTKIEVISPWQSPMNYAPYSLKTLKSEIARRTGLGIPGMSRMVKNILDFPGVWLLVSRILTRFDTRPGRLYSFVAEKN